MKETLDAGGTGLGRDIDDADTKRHCIYCVIAYGENLALHKALVEQDKEIASLHRSLQWRTLLAATAFILGFLLCSVLGIVAVWL